MSNLQNRQESHTEKLEREAYWEGANWKEIGAGEEVIFFVFFFMKV